jgi:hypothetical protein
MAASFTQASVPALVRYLVQAGPFAHARIASQSTASCEGPVHRFDDEGATLQHGDGTSGRMLMLPIDRM